MIVDVVPFLNELSVLEWRFRELDPIVDRFIVVEARRTFRGADKPAHFRADRGAHPNRWRWIEPKLRNMVLSTLPDCPDDPAQNYAVQRVQREAPIKLMRECAPDDVIIVSDVDEIPSAAAVRHAADILVRQPGAVIALSQTLYYYTLDLALPPPHDQWLGTRIMSYATFAALGGHEARVHPGTVRLPNAGWHFAFFGGEATVREKVSTWHARQFDPRIDWVEHVNAARAAGSDWDISRRAPLRHVPPGPHLPAWVWANIADLGAHLHHGGLAQVEETAS